MKIHINKRVHSQTNRKKIKNGDEREHVDIVSKEQFFVMELCTCDSVARDQESTSGVIQ